MARPSFILVLLLALTGFNLWAGEKRCVVCQNLIAGKFYWMAGPALPEKQSICDACFALEARCTICRLPVNVRGRQLSDGRFLCPKDAEAGVFDEQEVKRIYEETRRELEGILASTGILPDRNVKVSMVDATQLRKLNQSLPSPHDDVNIFGLTRTRVRNKTEFEHDIYLASGLGRARLAAVIAHEYTHTWVHENIPPTRKLERDSVEGFCELVAYKLMTLRGEELEKKIILGNAYTRGQVNAFIQAENTHQFHRVVKWLKTGVDDTLVESTTQVLVLKKDTPEVVWPPPSAQLTRVPDRLELRGISGAAGRGYALVNNCTVTAGDDARIRVGNSNVNARCLEVRSQSVVLHVEGQRRPIELFLRAKPADLAGAPSGPPPASFK
jgi:hypothetical protein